MLKEYIIAILNKREGIEQRISSKDLLYRLNVLEKTSNRAMRMAIEELRGLPEGSRICSTTKNGGGYFIATTKKELEDYLRQDENRCKEMWQRIHKQRKAAGLQLNKTEQASLFDMNAINEENHYDYS